MAKNSVGIHRRTPPLGGNFAFIPRSVLTAASAARSSHITEVNATRVKSEALFILDQPQNQLCEFTASMLADDGIDDPLDRDLGVLGGSLGQRTRNEKYWANYIWRHSEQWETRFEVSHLETGYLGTTRNSQSMIYHFLAKYVF